MKRIWMLLVAVGCSGGVGPGNDSPVKAIVARIAEPLILVGSSTQATAILTGEGGVPITDRLPVWSSFNTAVATVDEFGIVTGHKVGSANVRASSGLISAIVGVTVRNPPAASITLSRESVEITIPNGAAQFIPAVKDAAGMIVENPLITWQSSAPLIATVNSSGLVTGVAAGTTTIRATVDGVSAVATVAVQPAPSSQAPGIAFISPSFTLRPGGTYVLSGSNYAPTIAGNSVLVDGVPVTVNAATATQLQITLPTTGFPCDPTHAAFVQVTANGLIGGGPATLQTAAVRTLLPGQSVILSGAADTRCNELALTGGQYVVSVYNASRSTVSPTSLQNSPVVVRGAVPAGTNSREALSPLVARVHATPRGGAALIVNPFEGEQRVARDRARTSAHLSVLARNAGMLRTSLSRVPVTGARGAVAHASAAATLGAITPVKLPNLDAANFCTSSISANMRTVFVGQRAIIVEDTIQNFQSRPTLAGQMDSYFQRLGQEFDDVIWPILTGNFGNPMAFDAQLSGTGKVIMVFSPRINAMQAGRVLGFAVSCDLEPSLPSSNAGEYFYAVVPTNPAAGFDARDETRDGWLRQIRATVIHEVKHITAFAERRARGLSVDALLSDVSWEEGMARAAEELLARAVYGVGQSQNAAYAPTVGCDIRFATLGSCATRPATMIRHFDALYQAQGSSEFFTPLGRPTQVDQTFYGSAWSVLRWAADHYGPSESQFLKDFTTNTTTGILNLEARTGRPWEEMLGEWSLAMYLDDFPGFVPENTRLRFPSWNLRDIWSGLCADLGPCVNPTNLAQFYPRPNPFRPRFVPFGNFTVNVSTLSGGAFALFELIGAQSARQLFEVRSPNGGDPPPTIRVAIVRIQ